MSEAEAVGTAPGVCWPSIVMAGDCDASPTSTVTPSAASRKVAIGSKRRARVAASRPTVLAPNSSYALACPVGVGGSARARTSASSTSLMVATDTVPT
jgi:hypothetical protein